MLVELSGKGRNRSAVLRMPAIANLTILFGPPLQLVDAGLDRSDRAADFGSVAPRSSMLAAFRQ